MSQTFTEMNNHHKEFIERQQIFFVGTAAPNGRINVSPKGMDTLRVLGNNRIAWLNLTGAENEAAAHLLESNRMTLMFCAFDGEPLILRLYAQAKIVHPRHSEWDELSPLFPRIAGARQIFDLDVDLVLTSCGMGVPLFDFKAQRDNLQLWAERIGEQGLQDLWERKNRTSMDGKPTEIFVEEPAAT